MIGLGYSTMIHLVSSTVYTQQPQNSKLIPLLPIPLLKTVHSSFLLHVLSLFIPHLKTVVL